MILGLDWQLHVNKEVMDSGIPRDINLGNLSNHMSNYLLLSKSEIKNKAYTHSFQRWAKFIKDHGYNKVAAKPVHVALYLTHLLVCGASYSTVNSKIYSIKWMHNLCGLDDPTDNSFVKSLQDSTKILSAKPVRRKDPIDNDMLQSLCSLHKTQNMFLF